MASPPTPDRGRQHRRPRGQRDLCSAQSAAGEDVALKCNTSTITLTGATTAGDDVLLTSAGAIATGAVTASGTGPDTRTVTFGAGALDAAYAAETNAGGDIVATSTGASFTGNGALTAASDVTVTPAPARRCSRPRRRRRAT